MRDSSGHRSHSKWHQEDQLRKHGLNVALVDLREACTARNLKRSAADFICHSPAVLTLNEGPPRAAGDPTASNQGPNQKIFVSL